MVYGRAALATPLGPRPLWGRIREPPQTGRVGPAMSYLFFRTKIADYDKWKQAFDKDAEDRKAGGSEGGQLFRDDSDPNLVFILFKWDLAKAREYGQSEHLQEAMQEAGVTEPPDIFFMEEVDQLSS